MKVCTMLEYAWSVFYAFVKLDYLSLSQVL